MEVPFVVDDRGADLLKEAMEKGRFGFLILEVVTLALPEETSDAFAQIFHEQVLEVLLENVVSLDSANRFVSLHHFINRVELLLLRQATQIDGLGPGLGVGLPGLVHILE